MPELKYSVEEQRLMDLSSKLHARAKELGTEYDEFVKWKESEVNKFIDALHEMYPGKFARMNKILEEAGQYLKAGNEAHFEANRLYLGRNQKGKVK